MIEGIDMSLVDWSRAQFALTALYHWLFVPLTLGLSFIIACMETIYYRTKDERWKTMTQFWMRLFGVNFAIGVATGIIMEFEFGLNWSNYSWFVGDIFGAPLAIEGIMAFFMESTFIAIMFFGWKKVSRKFHLASTWLVAIGSNLSALWILIANGWMQYPVGMTFNPATARNEMTDFARVVFSPVAMHKFVHTVTSGYALAGLFVIGVSAWFLWHKRHVWLFRRSIVVAGVFGLVGLCFTLFTGDGSAYDDAHHQPMKLAAMEGLYDGQHGAGITAIGILNPSRKGREDHSEDPFLVRIELPHMLSILGYHKMDAFVPGINDIIKGGYKAVDEYGNEYIEPSAEEKIRRGKASLAALKEYMEAKKAGDTALMATSEAKMRQDFKYFGYGYLNDPEQIIPNVPITFYAFHIMVLLGFLFLVFFITVLIASFKQKLHAKWLLVCSMIMLPLAFVCSESGWIVAEVGRQPWVIQNIMPTLAAVSRIDASAVMTTFIIFAVLFTGLLIVELSIMFKQIKLGPKKQQS